MSKDILRGTSWPLTRILSTAQRAALTQDQINLMPVGFLVEEIEANIFVALWVRDTLAVGGLRQLVTNGPITLEGDVTGASDANTVSEIQGTPITVNVPLENDFLMVNGAGEIVNQAATVAALAPGATYVEEYDIPIGDPGARVVVLSAAQRNVRLVGFVVAVVTADAITACDVAVQIGPPPVFLASLEIGPGSAARLAIYAEEFDVSVAANTRQVAQGAFPNITMSEGDFAFRAVLTWRVIS